MRGRSIALRTIGVGVTIAVLVACGPEDAPAVRPTGALASASASASYPPTSAGSESPSPSQAPKIHSRVVAFPSSAGERLVGRLFAAGRPRGIVLAHQIDDDQTDWFEFARTLARHRFTVLTFNFEGYCGGGGCSRRNSSSEELWKDISGAVAYLRARGTDRIGLLGASMGGEASIAAAAHIGSEIAGVATLSASIGLAEAGPGAARRDVRSIDVPKLFVAGRFDTSAASAAQAFDRAAAEPKRLVVLPYGEHGVDLLDFEPGERTQPLILRFFERALR